MARPRNPRTYGPWAILPDDLLLLVLVRLGFFDFFTFAGVCKAWRVFAANQRENFFNERQQPFIIIISSYARRACSFLNIFDRRRYKTLLPNIICKSVLGVSGGYIIMQEVERTWIINPLTKDEHHFPSLYGCFTKAYVPNFRSILVYSPHISDLLMIAVCRGNGHFIISRPGSSEWQTFKLPLQNLAISDIAVFKGRIYILTVIGEIYQLSIFPYVKFKQLPVKNGTGLISSFLQLVATDDRLFIVDFKTGNPIKVYEVDFTAMELVRTLDLGEEALFFGEIKCSSLANPTKWGARGNCMYVLEVIKNRCTCFSMDGSVIESTPILEPHAVRSQPFMWYFPPLSCHPHILDY